MPPVILPCVLVAIAPMLAPQDATALAEELLLAGSSAFDRKDAAALAATYDEGATISLTSKTEDGFEVLSYEGRERIRSLYTDLFSNAGTIRSKNVVEYARLAGPDLLVIAGTFEPGVASSPTLQFVQIRAKQGDGTWLIRELTLIPIPQD